MSAMPHCRPLTACRLCGSADLATVLTLTPTPPANSLIAAADVGKPVDHFPLEVRRCNDCGHIQLRHVVDPAFLFKHYLYVSGTSSVMRNHLADQARSIAERYGRDGGKFIVEIGSNDGSLLRNFQTFGWRVLGVDPAENLAKQANADGIPTVAAFFVDTVARQLASEHGKADAVVANHCFAHIADLDSVVRGVGEILRDDGVFVFEVGYLLDVYSRGLFDTIYHEHLDYHHVTPLTRFFRKHGMSLVHVERVDIQGGALRGFVRLGGHEPDESVRQAMAQEDAVGITRPEAFALFARKIEQQARELKSLLTGLKKAGARIAGYGIPAKATTLMYHFGIDRQVIDYIVDDNPLKQGRFSAGLEIPIVPVSQIYSDKPDYLVLLAWNFAESIISMHGAYTEQGGRFVIPLPNLAVR
jgi:SAM-dependent methyltransferase